MSESITVDHSRTAVVNIDCLDADLKAAVEELSAWRDAGGVTQTLLLQLIREVQRLRTVVGSL